jgi:hypothetical protein
MQTIAFLLSVDTILSLSHPAPGMTDKVDYRITGVIAKQKAEARGDTC